MYMRPCMEQHCPSPHRPVMLGTLAAMLHRWRIGPRARPNAAAAARTAQAPCPRIHTITPQAPARPGLSWLLSAHGSLMQATSSKPSRRCSAKVCVPPSHSAVVWTACPGSSRLPRPSSVTRLSPPATSQSMPLLDLRNGDELRCIHAPPPRYSRHVPEHHQKTALLCLASLHAHARVSLVSLVSLPNHLQQRRRAVPFCWKLRRVPFPPRQRTGTRRSVQVGRQCVL
ncbi:hypothetical protein T440DRAFT_144255 [Plenodomus tracheiphilus IPT5]|uniref:Uncharacterized protein n=1 Tax=Plenodomus tracheiphilus IPT5 TaxID=1408161 RepID=A0A6A7B1K1_9PLEO|nr:hypothetical protein T440DRAFT_144255 [Plenodomus tracheiphilus IPT5]